MHPHLDYHTKSPPPTLHTPFPCCCMDFHDVKARKAGAMGRFGKSSNFSSILVLATLFFLSPWIPSAAAHVFHRLHFLFHQPCFVFLLLNVIITLIFLSSPRKSDQLQLLDPYVVHDAEGAPAPATDLTSPVEKFGASKSLVVSDQAATVKEASPEVVSTAEESPDGSGRREAAEVEMLNEETAEAEMVVVEQEKNPMDKLSSEEFRLRIEEFIAANKTTLFREEMAEAEWEANGAPESWSYRGDVRQYIQLESV